MRWPIQFQLLAPILTVVVLAIALASLGSAYFGGRRARQAQEDNLRRVVATLTEAPFPLSKSVLHQMSGLSGAEFVLLDRQDKLQAGTLDLGPDELEQLRHIHHEEPTSDLAGLPTTVLGGRSYLSRRVFVAGREPASKAGSLVILYPEDRWSAIMRQAAYPAITTGAVASLAIILVTTVLAHRFVRPIRRLGDRAAAIAQGDFSPQPEPVWRHDDEIRDLAISIHRMAEQLGQYEIQVRRHEQLRTLDRLGAGMAHQLRNAATGGRMAIELHRRECSVGQTSESLEVALRQLRLMESYLQRFMTLGRDQSLNMEKLCLATVVQDALSLIRPACIHAEIDLEFLHPDQPVQVCGDAEALRQLTVNLVANAVEEAGRQSETGPRIVVEVEVVNKSSPLPKGEGQGEGSSVEEAAKISAFDINRPHPNPLPKGEGIVKQFAILQVSDTGPGPSPQVADRLFEPFVSGKPEGTGLGLYVARQLVEAHHGSIRWERRDGMTCFTVELPILMEG